MKDKKKCSPFFAVVTFLKDLKRCNQFRVRSKLFKSVQKNDFMCVYPLSDLSGRRCPANDESSVRHPDPKSGLILPSIINPETTLYHKSPLPVVRVMSVLTMAKILNKVDTDTTQLVPFSTSVFRD